jgi:hypothetical protein
MADFARESWHSPAGATEAHSPIVVRTSKQDFHVSAQDRFAFITVGGAAVESS